MPGGFEFRGKRLVQKHQVFLSSTVFYPSRGLLEAGGIVDVYMIGGGQSGAPNSSGESYAAEGGSAGQSITGRVVVTGPSAVVVGAGGAAPSTSTKNNGGSSSFCGIVAAGGSGNSGGGRGGAGAGGDGAVGGYGSLSASGYISGRKYSNFTSASDPEHGGPPDTRGNGWGGEGSMSSTPTHIPVAGRGDGGSGYNSTYRAGTSGRVELTWWEYEQ